MLLSYVAVGLAAVVKVSCIGAKSLSVDYVPGLELHRVEGGVWGEEVSSIVVSNPSHNLSSVFLNELVFVKVYCGGESCSSAVGWDGVRGRWYR